MASHYLKTRDSEMTECGRAAKNIMSAAIGGGAEGVDCKQCLKRLAEQGIRPKPMWLITEYELNDIWEKSQGCPHKEGRMGEVIAYHSQKKLLEWQIAYAKANPLKVTEFYSELAMTVQVLESMLKVLEDKQ